MLPFYQNKCGILKSHASILIVNDKFTDVTADVAGNNRIFCLEQKNIFIRSHKHYSIKSLSSKTRYAIEISSHIVCLFNHSSGTGLNIFIRVKLFDFLDMLSTVGRANNIQVFGH